MLLWNFKCESEYFFWFCLFFNSGNRKWKQTVITENGEKVFFIFGHRSACFKRIFGSLAETLQKAAAHLCETLEITFRHYQTLQVNLNMADEAAHTCSQVTGSGRLRTNKTLKLSLELGTEKGRDISHWDVQSVQTFLVSCLPLRCRLFSEVISSQVQLRWLQRRRRLHDDQDRCFLCLRTSVGRLRTNKQVSSFSNISSELQDPNCWTSYWL